MSENGKQKVITGEFRLSFPSLHEKTSFRGSEPKYRLTMLFDKKKGKADVKKLLDAAKAVLKENPKNWSKKQVEEIEKGLIGKVIRDGDTKEYEGYEGCYFVTASNSRKPGVVDAKLDPIMDKEDVYPGCYCRASLVPFAFDVDVNKGIAFSLQNVQKIRDGESFLGTVAPEEDFDALEVDDEDSFTDDEDEEDPFD